MHIRLISLSLLLFVLFTSCDRTKTEFWPNGKKRSEIRVKDGRYEGEATYWFENGALETHCTYRNNLLDGPLRSYYPSGRLQTEQFYQAGKLHGKSRTWDRSGALAMECNYSGGVLHGRYQEFYSNQTPKVEGFFDHGSHDGMWLYYNESGLIVGKGDFVRGTGVQRVFDGAGRVKQMTHYAGNEKEGEEVFYGPDGKPTVVNHFERGKLIRKSMP